MENNKNYKKHMSVHFTVSAFIFLIIISSAGLTLFALLMIKIFRPEIYLTAAPLTLVGIAILGSIVLGTAISIMVSRFLLRPVDDLISAVNKVAAGDFTVRVKDSDSASELNDLRRSFNYMVSELEGTEMFRNDFINNFSHEFKTPIVSIRGFAKQLKKANVAAEQKDEYIDIIVDESDRLATMASNILLLTKFENQQMVADKAEFYLDEQIRKCILLLEKQWSKKNIEFNIDLDEVKYYSNEEMLSHVWLNILSNAIKFTGDGGIITVKCTKSASGAVTVKIADNGIGMDDKTLRHIFDKFYQGDSSHTLSGNGLGLPLAKRVIELCNGKISVKSQTGKGTTFTVRLPE